MSQTTPLQSITVPASGDNPDIPANILVFMSAMEKRGVMRFTDAANRDAVVTVPENGMFAWLTTTKILTHYDGVSWKTYNKTVQGLVVTADDGVNEGGEITLNGAAAHKNWGVDLYQNTMRFKYDVAGTPATIMTLSSALMTLGTGVRLVVGGVQQPVIHTGTAAPGAGLGSDGDLYVRYV